MYRLELESGKNCFTTSWIFGWINWFSSTEMSHHPMTSCSGSVKHDVKNIHCFTVICSVYIYKITLYEMSHITCGLKVINVQALVHGVSHMILWYKWITYICIGQSLGYKAKFQSYQRYKAIDQSHQGYFSPEIKENHVNMHYWTYWFYCTFKQDPVAYDGLFCQL